MDCREKRVSPGRGVRPGEVMAGQRYYEAYGTPFDLGEFYNDDETHQTGDHNPCFGHELEIITEIKRTPLPMGRKKRSRELGLLCMSDQQRSYTWSLRANRAFFKCKLFAGKSLGRVVSFLSWFFGGWKINTITESLGSSVSSYFALLRNIFLLNFLLFLFIFCFISIPQLVHPSDATAVPPNFTDSISLVVDGQGQNFEFSILYLGYHHGNMSSILGNVYKFPVVYLIVMFWAIMISFFWLLCSTEGLRFADQIRLTEHASPFTWRVLASWNHNLHHKNTVSERQAIIAKDLQGLVDKERSHLKMRSFFWCVYVARIFVSCVVFLWIAGGGAAIFFTVQTLRSDTCGVHYLHDNQFESDALNYFLSFRIALVVTALNTIFLFVNKLLMIIEFYGPHTRTVTTTIRVFLMYLVNMAVLIYSLLSLNRECTCLNGGYCCWETRVGQEIYRLFWIDLFAQVLGLLITDVGRGFLVRFRLLCKLSDWIGYQEFNLPDQTLALMYSQALVWFGMFFCPLLPLLAALRFSVLFLLKTWTARLANRAPSQLYHSRANVAYHSTVLLGLLLSLMVPLGWTVTQLTPSKDCGPFRHVSHMTDTITNEIHSWPGSGGHLGEFGLFVEGLLSSAVILPLLFLISLLVLFYCNKSKSLSKEARDLLIQSDADCRNSHNVLMRAVSMIPPYDPRLFDADPNGYGEFMTIHPHNIVPNYPPEAMITEGPMQDFVFYYDEHSHVPRQVHIGQSDIDEPI